MKINLKPLAEQVIVLTGATSGIGLATARLAARRGARLVLAARSEEALEKLADELSAQGTQVAVVPADVSRAEDVHAIAEAATERFGGFDTWINNAGIGLYGRIEDLPEEDMRRLFDINFFGVVHGSREAVKLLKLRGGALINIGSEVSDRAVPLQGIYSASKHAVKGFTDALRVELEYEDAPISVTLVKPGAIDTPFPHHAKNYLSREPQHAPPVYAPEAVARAILRCAETPVRDILVGGGAKLVSAMSQRAPRLVDHFMERSFIDKTHSPHAPGPQQENGLDQSVGTLQERGDYPGHVLRTSAYTAGALHPGWTGLALAGIAGLAVATVLGRNGGHDFWKG
jgi:short-subunit dehydrogenase